MNNFAYARNKGVIYNVVIIRFSPEAKLEKKQAENESSAIR